MLQYELDRLNHKDVRQRRMAVRRLFEIDDSTALAAFIDLLDDDDEWFVGKSIDALRRWVDSGHRPIVVTLSVRSEERLRMLAAELAPRIGTEALPILSTLCSDDNPSVRRDAWKARLKVDAGTIPSPLRMRITTFGNWLYLIQGTPKFSSKCSQILTFGSVKPHSIR